MYVYCIHPPISKSPKQLQNYLKIAETNVVLIWCPLWYPRYHIENIATSALKQVNVLRKLKFTLFKQALSNIRPVLEYACEVWDVCYERDIEILEKYN